MSFPDPLSRVQSEVHLKYPATPINDEHRYTSRVSRNPSTLRGLVSQADYGHLPTPVDNEHYHTLRSSQSPPAPAKSTPVAEYQEWPFQGFLKRTKIVNETT
ncbi:uncharacterized protein PAC_09996 [Phialocephala subalpina]|uniref:Uncharacterized protein n=1 Tax=Phialocephala subalpina TaxID=576137 RepID=A0A1L7X502_9HELO|nr:uncharacterized protein PAC_09996 [Phialocephala subalpina]